MLMSTFSPDKKANFYSICINPFRKSNGIRSGIRAEPEKGAIWSYLMSIFLSLRVTMGFKWIRKEYLYCNKSLFPKEIASFIVKFSNPQAR
jgi:hypothetical protein